METTTKTTAHDSQPCMYSLGGGYQFFGMNKLISRPPPISKTKT